jgi:hypothetical protein
MKSLQIGTMVVIRALEDYPNEYQGRIGQLVKIDAHSDDGDAFGVQLLGRKTTIAYFWREELEIEEEEQPA